MNQKTEPLALCQFCYASQKIAYYLYKIVIKTDKRTFEVGLVKLMNDINAWAMKKMLHLSASQLLLLRPDIINKYFQETYYKHKLLSWYFKEYVICKECYKDYAKNVPLQ